MPATILPGQATGIQCDPHRRRQIGKVFRFLDDATMGVLQEARLETISIIGRLAMDRAAPIVLAAGDVHDQEG